MSNEFEGKTVIVTGAGSGIGKAVALGLAREGANVVVNDLFAESAEAVTAEIAGSGGSAIAFTGDVSNPEDVKATVDKAVSEYGALHLAFNNAGITGPAGLPEDIDISAYQKLIDVNLNSVFYGLHYQVPAIINAGGGAIVNNSSILGLVGTASSLPYVTAKHGVTGMTKAAALAYATKGLRINSIHPGYIDTPLLSGQDESVRSGLIDLHPIGRLGRAEEIAELVFFLLSEKASFITGAQYAVDGGYTAQ